MKNQLQDLFRKWLRQQVSGWIPDGALLHLPLTDNLNYTVGTGAVTFNRSHTTGAATYISPSTGYLVHASEDEPRFEGEGLLVEQRSTNYILNTSDMSLPGWNYGRSSTAPATGIDNVANSTIVMIPNTENNTHPLSVDNVSNLTVAVGTYTTLTAYVKRDDQGMGYDVQMRIRATGSGADRIYSIYRLDTITAGTPIGLGTWAGNEGDSYSTIEDMGNGWRKLVLVAPNVDDPTGVGFQIMVMDGPDVAFAGDDASGLVFDGLQHEKKFFSTSWIPTGATPVNRYRDQLSIPALGNINPNGESYSVGVTIKPVKLEPKFNQFWWRVSTDGAFAQRMFVEGTSPLITHQINTYQSSSTLTDFTAYRPLATYRDDLATDNLKIYVDGSFNASKGTGILKTDTDDTIFIGSDTGYGSGGHGHLKHFVIYDRELDATEAQADYDGSIS